MQSILLLGAGKIGGAIAKMLRSSGDYDVCVGDVDDARLREVGGESINIDVTDRAALKRAMTGRKIVVSACTAKLNIAIAEAALESGCSYFDLTEGVETAEAIKQFASQAKPGQIFMPQCGLAPGFISIAAMNLASQFDEIDEVKLRVGALPQFPTNALKYNLTWSTDGLINEYVNPCRAIVKGKEIDVPPLEGLEHFSIDDVEYEAFNTSGGTGSLAETLAGKARALNYKTIRYPGHRDLMAFLLNELNLKARRELLIELLEAAIPSTQHDVVVTLCGVCGIKDGERTHLTDARKIYSQDLHGEHWSAIQLTTAAGLCAMVDLFTLNRDFDRGFARPEQIELEVFLKNRFGRYYVGTPNVYFGTPAEAAS